MAFSISRKKGKRNEKGGRKNGQGRLVSLEKMEVERFQKQNSDESMLPGDTLSTYRQDVMAY